MRFKQRKTLSRQQKRQITTLEAYCRLTDQTKRSAYLSTDLNFSQQIDCFYLAYEGFTLVGFLAMFIPTECEAEITAVTKPEFRKKGIFTKLLAEASKELNRIHVERLLFVHEPQSQSALPVIKKLNVVRERTEYLMKLATEGAFEKAEQQLYGRQEMNEQLIVFRDAREEDVEEIAVLEAELSGMEELDMVEYMSQILKNPSMHCYKAMKNGNLIGACCSSVGEKQISIFGVVVLETERQKGYGGAMFAKLMELLLKEKKEIVLQVSSKSEAAFELYKKFGFEISAQQDYYLYFLPSVIF